MTRDYLSAVLPSERPPVSADDLAAGQQIEATEQEAGAVHSELDMIRLNRAEQGQVGRASTAGEREINRLYADAATIASGLLPIIGQPEGAMQDGHRMEAALHIYREAVSGYASVCRSVFVLSAAALTEHNDRAEDAAAALAADPALPPERREIIGNVARSLDGDRDQVEGAHAARRARQVRREEDRQRTLQAARLRLAETERRAALAHAPLPLSDGEGGAP